jgi:hypothetical protein
MKKSKRHKLLCSLHVYAYNCVKLPSADWALAVQAIFVILALAANDQVATRDERVRWWVLVANDARQNGRGFSGCNTTLLYHLLPPPLQLLVTAAACERLDLVGANGE